MPMSFSMREKERISPGVINVIPTPPLPARAVRPIRCT